MRFQDVAGAIEGVPFMTPWQGRRLYDHLRETNATQVLELGTAHGASSAYMAAAVKANGGGSVTTVDRFHFAGPSPEETHARAGVADTVACVRVEHSSYTWWLRGLVQVRSDADGNCDPLYDFCYLDGAHEFNVDGMAVILVERLLRPGGWLLLDDLDWTHDKGSFEAPGLSAEERATPHMRAIFDLVIKPHPNFAELRDEDGAWGWARKQPGAPKRLKVERTVERRSMLQRRLQLLARRATTSLRRARGS